MDDIDKLIHDHGMQQHATQLNWHGLLVDLRFNVPEHQATRYFVAQSHEQVGTEKFRVDCIDLDATTVETEQLDSLADTTYRGQRFRTGYYLTHHFGKPAWIISRGRHLAIFGRKLEKIVWPYVVKYLLTVWGAETGALHLKAAGFTDDSDQATLLFGRGGGGKSVLLTQACLSGMRYLTNTHALARGNTVYGVPSVMRVRDDLCFSSLILEHKLPPHLEPGEYRLDPTQVFDKTSASGRVRNLCIVNYQPDRPQGIQQVSPSRFEPFIEQFGWAVTAYGLKDDLLAYFDGEIAAFTHTCEQMRNHLSELVHGSRLFVINADMLDPRSRDEVLSVLAG
ncbi:hypothetical protein [Streptomyces sp. MMG1533]|uniref:hypothetical protein n=1 Tax=Streptomyces sp. MMG1533 TaxID=1415546 RepID=UPI0006ADE665|nr:hypothetical protein [Streptomyces sp. MMG1533]